MEIDINKEKIEEILNRGVEDVIDKKHLEDALLSGRQLRVKFGVDPTAPDLHLGHSIPLRKLKQFQDLGHQVVLLIGDFTAKIGDPTGRDVARKPLIDKDIQKNMENYLAHAGKILNIKKTEIVYNSEWFAKESAGDLLELTKAITFQQIMKRADFQKRIKEGNEITLNEILYPVLQGYDSVKVKADVEIGGTDQIFNLLTGRRVQRYYGFAEQDIVIMPLFVGTDGVKKMSKSANNYIGLTEKPFPMLEKLMHMPEFVLVRYIEGISEDEAVAQWQKKIDFAKGDLLMEKLVLAESIVAMYHSNKDAKDAKDEFVKVFFKKENPSEMKKTPPALLKNALAVSGITSSMSAAQQLIEGGGVRVNNEVEKDWKRKVKKGDIIKAGKSKFVEISEE